jgi:hypothetical protein
MTELLRKAFQEASKLPPGDQDALASVLLEELAGEFRWDSSLAGSPEKLVALADSALAEYRAGKTQPLDPDTL